MFFAMSGLAKFSATCQTFSWAGERAIYEYSSFAGDQSIFGHKFNFEYGTPVIRFAWRAVNPICLLKRELLWIYKLFLPAAFALAQRFFADSLIRLLAVAERRRGPPLRPVGDDELRRVVT
jgi:hypothetical protein